MKPLERKLKTILEHNVPWYFRVSFSYLKRPILYDLFIGSAIAGLHWFVACYVKVLFQYDVNSIIDIINELISSSLSAGGFVLAALAIIASIKESVPKNTGKSKPKSGKEYFYNSIGYKVIIVKYGYCCLMFLFLFLYFVFVRSIVGGVLPITVLHLTIIGISILILSFLRCIALLWVLIRI